MKKRGEDGPNLLDGVKISRGLFDRSGGIFKKRSGIVTYSVSTAPSERRVEKRCAVRLQSGKVLDAGGRFLADFLFVNRGGGGARIALAQRASLPKNIWLYEDVTKSCRGASVVWRNGRLVGCRFNDDDMPFDASLLKRYQTKYYAV
jgi:hypothetical protein